ncbi:MAG: hypothetical protein JSS82_02950 [Bacteroidetes bacterium]|nr:hypothetical protein [Bacteroidota bacterium]
MKLEGDIYKSKITIFSKHEEASLLAIQELMKNPEKYFKDIYNPIVARDTKKYVYREQQPSYHTYKDCPRLSADFTNFELPGEIAEKGDAEIERFRAWFKENENLLSKPEIFVMRLQIAFGITYNPKAINYENSGFDDFKNYSVKELEDTIDNLLRKSAQFYHTSSKHETILRRFSKMSATAFTNMQYTFNDTGYSEEEIKELLQEYHKKFKLPLKKLLIEYYRVKLNPDLQFAENLLEALGFKKCGNCKKREVEVSLDFLSGTDKKSPSTEEMDDLPF